jgi:hypothetical protein
MFALRSIIRVGFPKKILQELVLGDVHQLQQVSAENGKNVKRQIKNNLFSGIFENVVILSNYLRIYK